MNYAFGVGAVAFGQLAVSALTVAAGTGNGSFVGLGAMLLALFGIPLTALVNALLVRDHRRRSVAWRWGPWLLVSSVLPMLQIALWVAQVTLHL